jgi:hypothetical protein
LRKESSKDEPIQLSPNQIERKKDLRRSKTSDVDPTSVAEKRKNLSAAKLKKKQQDRELWIKL